MSIPLDRLYNFLEDIVNQDIIIYRWSPHGSKKLTNLQPSKHIGDFITDCKPVLVIAHDQEPLDHDRYTNQDLLEWKQQEVDRWIDTLDRSVEFDLDKFFEYFKKYNLRTMVTFDTDRPVVLLHSEKNSDQLNKFINSKHIPVYYWSHAVIAKDWFRYAEHDLSLHYKKITKPFLIYNRAWLGTREYRLKFAELLVKNNLTNLCCMGFNQIDTDQNYQDHIFKNPAFCISSFDLQNYFFENNSTSTASADYCSIDYQQTEIEIVLETLFDDTRWHLTEKTLRPIACGQPFVLAAAAGSLQYLRSYGFETFAPILDETYDDIQDPVQRLNAIIVTMKQYLSLAPDQKQQLRAIALRNQQHFFSHKFQQHVIDEFKNNFNQAILTIVPSQLSGGGLAS